MYTVEFPPGLSSPVHRHNAPVSVYVLEGSVVMQVKGGKEITLTPGQSFYEGPNDVHVVSRNASDTKPAKFLVFLVKHKGAPVLVPVSDRRNTRGTMNENCAPSTTPRVSSGRGRKRKDNYENRSDRRQWTHRIKARQQAS